MKPLNFILYFLLFITINSYAQTPIQVEADQMRYDDIKKINTLTGRVVIKKENLILKAQQVIITQNSNGHHQMLMTGNNEQRAYFEQRDLQKEAVVQGWAKQIEYDDQTEILYLKGDAEVKRLQKQQVTDQAKGENIVYERRTAVLRANNQLDNSGQNSRIKLIIQPLDKKNE